MCETVLDAPLQQRLYGSFMGYFGDNGFHLKRTKVLANILNLYRYCVDWDNSAIMLSDGRSGQLIELFTTA
jgi:hypothetical protein